MLVEFYGGSLDNFGDELMIRRIIQELTARIPDFIPARYPKDVRFRLRSEIGFLSVLPGKGRGPLAARAAVNVVERLFPGRLERLGDLYGAVAPSAVQGLVTSGGYVYSDHWGPGNAERAERVFGTYARAGKPVILLPQALGPFQNERVRRAFRGIIEAATLVLARDSYSLQHTLALGVHPEKIRQTHDITLVEPRDSAGDREPDRVSIVPNQRMLDKGSSSWRDRYLDVLSAVARALVATGMRVDIVVHGRESDDLALAVEIARRVQGVRPATFQDPREARRHLARATAVVGSRYHALVGSLAHAVPTLAVGWAHKYRGLFEDFGISEYCVEDNEAESSIVAKALELCSLAINQRVRESIDRRLREFAAADAALWDDVALKLSGAGTALSAVQHAAAPLG